MGGMHLHTNVCNARTDLNVRHPAFNFVNPLCCCSGSPPGGYPGVRVGPPGQGGRRPQLRHAALPLPRLPAGRAAAQVQFSTVLTYTLCTVSERVLHIISYIVDDHRLVMKDMKI